MDSAEDFLSQYEPSQNAQSAEGFLSQYAPSSDGGDMLKSGAAGLSKSVASAAVDPFGFLATGPRMIIEGATRLGGAGYESLADKTGLPHLSEGASKFLTYPVGGDPESTKEKAKSLLVNQIIPEAVQETTGMDMNYQPQTMPGEYSAAVGGVLPYMVQGLPLKNAVGMGIGAKAGSDITGLFTDNPKYKQTGSVIGGASGAMAAPHITDAFTPMPNNNGFWKSNTSDPHLAPPLNLNTEDLHDLSSTLFGNAREQGNGVVLPPNSANSFVKKVNKIGLMPDRVKQLVGSNAATAMIEGLQSWKNKPITFEEADALDRSITKQLSTQSARNPITGELTAEGNDLHSIQHALRETTQEVPDDPAFATQNLARKAWAAYLKQKQIDQIVDNAELSENPANAIRTGAKALAKKLNKNPTGWSDEEIKGVRYMAKSGIVGGSLRFASSRIVPLIATIIGGGMEGGGAGIALNEASKTILGKMQMNRAKSLSNIISNQPNVIAAHELANMPPESPSGFSMIPTPPELPAPAARLALPAPPSAMIPSNQSYTSPANVAERPYSGQMRWQTPEERDASISAQQNPDNIAAQNARADQTPSNVLNTELRQKQAVTDSITAWRKSAKALSDKGYTHKEIVNKIGVKPRPPES